MVRPRSTTKKNPAEIKLGKRARSMRSGASPIIAHLRDLSASFNITSSIMAEILEVSPKTLSRYRENEKELSPQQRDRVEIVESIMELGKRVLGDEDEVRNWLRRPVHSIENRRPIDLITSESGRRRVENALLQIEGGAF